MNKPAHPIRNIVVGVAVLLGVIGLVFAVRYVTHVPFMNISQVEVIGGETINHDIVRTLVERRLEGEYLKLIPRRFVWFYPYDAILADVGQVERVHNVRVTQNERVLTVQFDEFTPSALWCQTATKEKCVFLTEDGYGFAPAPQLTGGSFVRFLTLGHEPTPGQTAIEATDYYTLNELIALLASRDWFVEVVEFDKERDAFIHLTGGSELKVTLRQTPTETFSNLLTILGSEQFAHLTPGNFAYIDLRFGEKIFVNEHGQPAALVASSTASSTVESDTEIE